MASSQTQTAAGQPQEGLPHLHWEHAHTTPPSERLSPVQKISYGLGTLTDFFYANILNLMYTPIYVIAMKLDPGLIGIAMGITRMIGAVTDPFVGNLSDNTRTRWGRRRPFIVAGTLAGALLLPLLWCVPGKIPFVQYGYIFGILALFTVIYSFFFVPYGALGFELTNDYDERTRVFAWRGYIQTAAIFSGSWFYWITLRPIFGNEVVGVRWLSILGGILMITCVLVMVRCLREKSQPKVVEKKDRVPVLSALKQTFGNRPFMLIQAGIQVVFLGIGVDGPIGQYLNVYYICQGDKSFASLIGGTGGTLVTVSIFASPALAMWLSTRLGKREAALGGLGIMLISVLLIPITMTPAHPYWIIVTWVLSAIGGQCCTLLAFSMMADVCDEDEVQTGQRREGIYFASSSFLAKCCQVFMLLVGGWIPHLAGYTDFSVDPTPVLLERMKTILIVTQLIGVVAAIALIWFYPITRARAAATRKILDERAASQAAAPGAQA